MALERQNAVVSLTGGVDTKSDPKQVVPGKLLALENGVFGTKGKIRKRNGYGAVGPVAGAVSGVFAYQNELLATTGSRLLSLDLAKNTWRDRGSCRTVGVTDTPVVRNDYSQSNCDTAAIGSLRCVVWEDSRGGCRYSILDTTTGQRIVDDATLDASADAHDPRVVALDANFAFFYVISSTTTLTVRTLDVATLTLTAPGTVSSDTRWSANYRAAYDVTTVSVSGSQVAFITRSRNSGNFIDTRSLNSSLAFSSDVSQATGAAVNRIGIFWDGTNLVIPYAQSSGPSALYFMTVSSASPPVVTTTPVNTTKTSAALTIGFTGGVESGKTLLIYGEGNAVQLVTKIDITGYAVGTITTLLRSVWLASKAFAYSGALYFTSQAHISAAQQCCFVHDTSGNVVARLFVDGGQGGMSAVSVSGSVATVALLPVDRLAINTGGWNDTRYGVDLIALDFGAAPTAAILGNVLHVSGGLLTMYDGSSTVEHGFFFFPEIASTSLGAGALTGTYGYVCTYEWTDAQGNVHRSAPSPVKSVSPSSQNVTLTIPTLRITGKKAPRGPVQIVVYRTINNGSIYYRYTGVLSSSALYNDPTVDTVTWVDSGQFADGPLQSNPLLYTTGNVLENDAPPACRAMAVYKNRLVLVDAEHPLRLWYSKQVVPGQPVEFDAGATLNIDPAGGPAVTALAALDDKLIVFKRDVIFFVTGTGPDPTGGQNDFSTPLLINTNSGCIEPRSVVTASDGVMYQSAKGIFLLDRALQDSYIGADVEAYNASTITGVQMVPNTNEVRFTLGDGTRSLVYDYLYHQWSVFTGLNAQGAAVYGNQFAYITPAGQVYQETPGAFLDGAAFIPLKITTSWLQVAGLQGFQRAYKLLLLGDWVSAHTLTVTVAVDFSAATVQTATFTGQNTPLQWRLNLARQKCEAIQIHIEDSQTPAYGEGYSLSALAFEVGVKRGPFRFAPSQAA